MGFLLEKHRGLPPYVPGDHAEGDGYIRLNTNESPYPPSPSVLEAVKGEVGSLQFYNDPDCTALRAALAERYALKPENVLCANGSDEALYFAFLAFADAEHPIALPDVTYGYYDLFAASLGIPLVKIPLKEDFSVDPADYEGIGKMVVLVNPNAPTGLFLPPEAIRRIAQSNPDNVVLIDEAYIDFGGESCLSLIGECPNLLVVRTYSKSRSMAGARIGFAMGCESLIAELETIRNAVNLYSVNRMSQAAGIAAVREDAYYMDNCRRIEETREWTKKELERLGFTVLPSKTNFLFALSPEVSSKVLYEGLRLRNILIRRWDAPRVAEWARITIGTREQMSRFIEAVEEILSVAEKERKL